MTRTLSATVLSVLAVVLLAAPASAATDSWSVVNDANEVKGSVSVDPTRSFVTVCDLSADNVDVRAKYLTANDDEVRTVTTAGLRPGTCTVGRVPAGDVAVVVRASSGDWTTGWQLVG